MRPFDVGISLHFESYIALFYESSFLNFFHLISFELKISLKAILARWVIGLLTSPLPWNGGRALTAFQVHAVNLIELD